jgi:probable HAF family extracellular repeat protein
MKNAALITASRATALFLLAGAASAQPEYQFMLVEAFTPNYNLREAYIWDMNDQGAACGTATREFQVTGGTSITYSGFTWTAAAEKTPLDAITWPRGINNNSWVVGGNTVYNLSTNTTIATIPNPPGGVSGLEALGLNDAGTVVGMVKTCACSNSNGLSQIPFVWDPVLGVRNVPVPSAKDLRRINAAGVAVGIIRYSAGIPDAYVYDTASGSYTVLGGLLPPPTGSTIWMLATDINDAGLVTGERRTDDGQVYRGYTWSSQAGFVFFDGLTPNLSVHPQGINNAGTVVGYAQIDPGTSNLFHAFVWDSQHGTRDLNALAQGIPAGFIIDRALKINDQGWIVGDGHYGPNWGTSRAFVLKPLTQSCYANCDGSSSPPILNVNDFICFQTQYAAGDPSANCDHSTTDPVLNVLDFVCFQTAYATGCQ